MAEDPISLAELGLNDATKSVALNPLNPDAYLQQVIALIPHLSVTTVRIRYLISEPCGACVLFKPAIAGTMDVSWLSGALFIWEVS